MSKFIAIAFQIVVGLMFFNQCSSTNNYIASIDSLSHGLVQKQEGLDPKTATPLPGNEIGYLDNYYYVINLTVSAPKNNDGMGTFNANIVLSDIDVYSSTIFNADTGQTNEIPFTNPGGGRGLNSQLVLNVPKDQEVVKYNITLSIIPKRTGTSRIQFNFVQPESQTTAVEGVGKIGFSRDLIITSSKIATPQLGWNSNTQTLFWNHVQGSAHYKLYVNGEVLKKVGENTEFEKTADDPLGNDGELMTLGGLTNLGLFGYNFIQIKAFPNVVYITPSNLSNGVEVIL